MFKSANGQHRLMFLTEIRSWTKKERAEYGPVFYIGFEHNAVSVYQKLDGPLLFVAGDFAGADKENLRYRPVHPAMHDKVTEEIRKKDPKAHISFL